MVIVGEILHYFAGVGVAFLVLLDEAFDGIIFPKPSAAAKVVQDGGFQCTVPRQPWLPRGQEPAVGKDGVAEFAGVAIQRCRFAVNDSHADAFVDVQEDHILKCSAQAASPMTRGWLRFLR